MPTFSQQLLIPNTTVRDGPWVDLSAFSAPMSVIFFGLKPGDTCELRVDNSVGAPLDASQGVALGSQVTQDGPVSVTEPYRWMRARQTANAGGGTVSANLAGTRSPMA